MWMPPGSCPHCGAPPATPPTAVCPRCHRRYDDGEPVAATRSWFSPWWVKLALILVPIVLIGIGLLLPDDDHVDPDIKAHYAEWRAECEDYATAQLAGTPYEPGGNHWVDIVNDCLVDKAADSAP